MQGRQERGQSGALAWKWGTKEREKAGNGARTSTGIPGCARPP